MFSGGNFRVKIEIQKSVSEFARRYGMPDVGAGACVLPSPPALGRQAARPGPAPPRYGRGPAGPAGPAAPPGPAPPGRQAPGSRPIPPRPQGKAAPLPGR